MPVPLLDIAAQYEPIATEIQAAIAEVFKTHRYIGGPIISRFEEQVAEYCGAPFGVGVSSGTDALLVSLMAECVGPGDEVITTPFTFFATGGCISRVGAKPVFVDIKPDTFNIDPVCVENAITERTRAILPVHLFGQCADMDALEKIASDRGLAIIEDAAQAIGSEFKGRRAGSMGHYGCFSFFPSKNLGGIGDGGFVTCNDEERFERVKKLRSHGAHPKYFHSLIGGNFRLDAIQAAVLEVKLRHLDNWHSGRQSNAERYHTELAPLAERGLISLPVQAEERRHIWNQFTIRVHDGKRDQIRDALKAANVGNEVYYPVPLHLQDCFAQLGYERGQLPHSELAAAEVLSIPIYGELSSAQQDEVVKQLKSAFSV